MKKENALVEKTLSQLVETTLRLENELYEIVEHKYQ